MRHTVQTVFFKFNSLGHSQVDSLTNPMLIAAFWRYRTESHWEPRNKVGSISPFKHLLLLLTFLINMKKEHEATFETS